MQVSFEASASLHPAVSRGSLPASRLRTPAARQKPTCGLETGEEPGSPGPASHSHSHSHSHGTLASSSRGGRRLVLISGAWLGSEARRGVINPEKSAKDRAEEEVGGGRGPRGATPTDARKQKRRKRPARVPPPLRSPHRPGRPGRAGVSRTLALAEQPGRAETLEAPRAEAVPDGRTDGVEGARDPRPPRSFAAASRGVRPRASE